MKSNIFDNSIGGRIRKLRKQKGETQGELADALYTSRQIIHHWENGNRDIKTTNTVALANHFGVSCDYILRGIEPENSDVFKLLGLNNNSMEAIKRIWEQYPLMGNRFLDKLFSLGFESVVMDWQSLFYTSIAAKNGLDKRIDKNPDYKDRIEPRVNEMRPIVSENGDAMPGLYDMTLDIDGYIDIRLQQISAKLNSIMKNAIEDARIEAKKRASADLRKLLAEIDKRTSKKPLK